MRLWERCEEVLPTTLYDACVIFEDREPKGEYVLVIEGKSFETFKQERKQEWQAVSIEEHMEIYESQGVGHKDAMKRVAKDRGISKSEVYKSLIKNENL